MLAVIAALAAGGVSAPDPQDPELITRTYDLRPLVETYEDSPAHTKSCAEFGVVFGSSFTFDQSGKPCHCPDDATTELDPKSILAFIDWISLGARGLGTAIPEQSFDKDSAVLTVKHTAETHAMMSAFREAFLAARGRPILVDVAIVPAEAVASLACGKPLAAGAFDDAAALAGTGGRSFSLRAMNGQTVSDFAGRRRLEVIDAEINQTGAIPVSNPVIGPVFLGATVEVQPLWTGAGELVRLKLDVSQAAEAGPIERRKTFFADLDLAPLRKDILRTTVIIPAGATVVAGVLEEAEDGKPRSFAVVVRARAGSAAAQLPPETKGDLGILIRDISFITESPDGEEPLLSTGSLLGLIREQVDPAVREDDRLALEVLGDRYFCALAPPDVLAVLGRWLDARALRRARQAILTLEEYEGSAADVLLLRREVVSGAAAPAVSSKLQRKLKVMAAGAPGIRISAGGFVERTVLADAEYVSGGTGFSTTAIADPVMMAVRTGFELEEVVTESGKDFFRLDLDSRHRRADIEGQISVLAPSNSGILGIPPSGSPWASGSRDPGPLWFGMPYQLDQPRETSFGGRTTIHIPRSRRVVVRMASGAGPPARILLAGVSWIENFESGN